MKLQTALDNMGCSNIRLLSDAELRQAVATILEAEALDAAARDVLRALYREGPLWDGDLPSKQGRDTLVNLGFAVRIVVKSSSGYNACTLLGAEALQIRGLD